MAGNPNWKAGGKSPNPNGRRKYKNSAKTVKGQIERFLKSKLSLKELNSIYEGLSAKDKGELLTGLLPYTTPKQTQMALDVNIDRMTDEEVEAMHSQLFAQVSKKLSFESLPFEEIPMPEIIPNPEKLPNNDNSEQLEANA